ncbi:uncharacterized protein BO95DRAFT_385144 [Aspergillus brunneoviolaceus CBS 621.78]|uniref:Uncharacterized protein n=1 Tax=Aspergillus brunneoviolaceus CBS 621.78 TaxID=1450534 RepID=A0ACD1GF86_9EURO|nr:hypothetical protein BO95DRAFT_385144 [Aspergillus brunneoviolaceus CBS 621.78]RAH47969.1 hypothetical protein BO95DRAFT_385144 [Aspergillus brunneoviolaceus CBS 621.78]
MTVVTDTNRAPVIGILAWFFMVIAVLSGGTRLLIKYVIVRKLTMDDYLISVALVFSVLQAACVANAAGNGYGQEQRASSQHQQAVALKSIYAAELLYIPCITFAKLSSLAFMTFLMQRTRKVEWGLIAFITTWAMTCEVAVAFQCGLPQPWNWLTQTCFNRAAWWYYFGITNILTECALMVFPILVVSKIQMADTKKAVVIGCFATRILVVIAIVMELVYRGRMQEDPDEPLLEIWKVAVCMQLVQCLAIIVSCIPHLKPFMDGLQSTGLRLYHLPGQSSTHEQYGYGSGKKKRSGTAHELNQLHGSAHDTTILAEQRERDWDDAHSQTSQSHIIRQTMTWAVEEHYDPNAATESITTDGGSNRSQPVR